jgi:hypothetical protein
MKAVNKKVKIGDVEFRIVAKPASTPRSAQAMSVKGTTLLRQACVMKRRHVAQSLGRCAPRDRMTARRIRPAIVVRAAIGVTGGMVSTPSLMKV